MKSFIKIFCVMTTLLFASGCTIQSYPYYETYPVYSYSYPTEYDNYINTNVYHYETNNYKIVKPTKVINNTIIKKEKPKKVVKKTEKKKNSNKKAEKKKNEPKKTVKKQEPKKNNTIVQKNTKQPQKTVAKKVTDSKKQKTTVAQKETVKKTVIQKGNKQRIINKKVAVNSIPIKKAVEPKIAIGKKSG